MEVIEEDEVADHALQDVNKDTAELDLTEPSNIDVLIHDMETQKDFREQNLKKGHDRSGEGNEASSKFACVGHPEGAA